MTDSLLYEYAVVRYVPHVEREEFLNIGLVMMCKRQKWLKGKILLDEKRLQALDPNLNIEPLKAQCALFEKEGVPFSNIPIEERYRWLTAAKSAILQTSPSHPGIIMRMDHGDVINKREQGCFHGDKNEKETVSNLLLDEFNRLFSELVCV